MSGDPMVDEFDTVATWTADAVEALGPDHALPAACRGSGSPAALDWLVAQLHLGPGTRLLDSGAGVGGPSQYAAEGRGVRPVLAEPMPGACRAAVRLFGLPVVAADGASLPFGDGAFDAAWSMGVLCTVEDKEQHLRELARTVTAGAPVGLLVFVREVDHLPDEPDGNHFPALDELVATAGRAGLRVDARARLDDFAASPEGWQQAADRVSAWIEAEHGPREAWRAAADEQQVVGDLIGSGSVSGQLLVCRAAASP